MEEKTYGNNGGTEEQSQPFMPSATAANQNVHETDNIDNDANGRVLFYVLVIILQILGVISIIVVVSWCINYFDGYAWDGSGKEFNYHPTFMVVGLIVFYGNSAVSYRVLRYQNKYQVKLIHAFLHLFAFIFAVLGLVAVFDFHNAKNIPNVYSLHSWIGIGTVVLFGCQLLFGFLCFLFPMADDDWRRKYLKIHVFFGVTILALAVVAVISGITEKMLFAFKAEYSQMVAVGNIANMLGVLVTLFAMLVGYIIYNPNYKRLQKVNSKTVKDA